MLHLDFFLHQPHSCVDDSVTVAHLLLLLLLGLVFGSSSIVNTGSDDISVSVSHMM